MDRSKQVVHEFWEKAACGEALYLSSSEKAAFVDQERIRYELEPYIPAFADFEGACGMDVLEIGVGLVLITSDSLKQVPDFREST